jgi:hypothetical protein
MCLQQSSAATTPCAIQQRQLPSCGRRPEEWLGDEHVKPKIVGSSTGDREARIVRAKNYVMPFITAALVCQFKKLAKGGHKKLQWRLPCLTETWLVSALEPGRSKRKQKFAENRQPPVKDPDQ